MSQSLFDLPKTKAQLEQQQSKRDAILYIDYNPEPHICPYCGNEFADIVGCHKICRCGYMEGCGD